MRWRSAAVAVAAVVVAAGCSGDDDAGAVTTTTVELATSTTSAPEATSPPTSTPGTTSPPSSVPDTTPSTVATTAPTSSAPDTTLDPDDRAANTLAIIETVERSFEIYNAALNDPFNEAKVEALGSVFTPRLLEGWINLIEDYRENNYRSLANPNVPARYDIDVNSVEVNLNSGTASVQACHLDSFVKVQVGGNADGTDRVVDDQITEQVERLDLLREDGQWKVHRAILPDESESDASCG